MGNEKRLDQEYWDTQYKTNATGWDLGKISPAIQAFTKTLENKNTRILIPGCGNSYEAEHLLNEGFTNITVIDIAPTLIENLQKKFQNNPNILIILDDFFELAIYLQCDATVCFGNGDHTHNLNHQYYSRNIG